MPEKILEEKIATSEATLTSRKEQRKIEAVKAAAAFVVSLLPENDYNITHGTIWTGVPNNNFQGAVNDLALAYYRAYAHLDANE